MKNLWIQTEAPIASWYGDLRPVLDRPTALVEFVRDVLVAGAEARVVLPVSIPKLGVTTNGDAAAAVARTYEVDGVVDLFKSFASATIEGDVAYHDASGEVVERRVSDLGALLAELAPDRVYRDYRATDFAPVHLTGTRVRVPATPVDDPYTFRVELHSDIWFPFVLGLAHPERDLERWFDNRALAARHTPRLNQFIARVAELVTRAGGTFAFEANDSKGSMLPWLGERGVMLDGQVPPLMPASMLDVEWPIDA